MSESVVQVPVVVIKDGKSVVYEAGSENAPKPPKAKVEPKPKDDGAQSGS